MCRSNAGSGKQSFQSVRSQVGAWERVVAIQVKRQKNARSNRDLSGSVAEFHIIDPHDIKHRRE